MSAPNPVAIDATMHAERRTRTNRSRASRPDSRHSGESGYAMLMAMGLVLVLLIASTAIIANTRIEGRRQREDEAIWRGNQYARAVRLYFHKTGHYPQTLEDLKKGMPQLHFLRQAYKDPMNKDDGSWRFIYVNAAGQIIGSTKYSSLQQMALLDSGALQNGQSGLMPGLGTPVSSLTNSSGFGSAMGDSSSTSAQNPPASTSAPQAPTDPNAPPPPSTQTPDPSTQNPQGSQPSGQNPGQPGAVGGGIGGAGTSPFGSLNGQPGNPADLQKPTGPVDGPVLGAFLTGVASKVDAPSQKVYHHGTKYLQWEFIWNPLEDAAANLQQTLNPQGQQGIGQPLGPGSMGPPVNSPFGSPPGTPRPPTSNPQMPQQ